MADPPGSPPTAKPASQGAHLQACDLSARARDEGDGGKGGGGGGGWGMLVGLEDMGEVIPRRGVGGRNKGGGGTSKPLMEPRNSSFRPFCTKFTDIFIEKNKQHYF